MQQQLKFYEDLLEKERCVLAQEQQQHDGGGSDVQATPFLPPDSHATSFLPHRDLIVSRLTPLATFAIGQHVGIDSCTSNANAQAYGQVKPTVHTLAHQHTEWASIDTEGQRERGRSNLFEQPAASLFQKRSPLCDEYVKVR